MKTETSNDEIRTEAAQWTERMVDEDFASAEREKLHRWLTANKSHAEEFLVHSAIANLARDLPDKDRAELLAYDEAPKTPRAVWISGLAASLALFVVFAVWLAYQYEPAAPHITTAETTRDITLPDGSVAHLNVRTDLHWNGDSAERRVALLEGEALFEVRHDAAKPFTVVVNQSEIRVLGTRFNVRRREDGDVIVTVLEGTVRVSPQRMQAGTEPAWTRTLQFQDQLVYNDAGLVRDIHAASQANAARWRDGVLEFHDETLSNVVEDLGRYTDRQILIRDQRVAQMRLGGQLDVRRDMKAALALLEKLAPVTVHEDGNNFVLDYRQEITQGRR